MVLAASFLVPPSLHVQRFVAELRRAEPPATGRPRVAVPEGRASRREITARRSLSSCAASALTCKDRLTANTQIKRSRAKAPMAIACSRLSITTGQFPEIVSRGSTRASI